MSDRNMRRNLHLDINLHTFIMHLVQVLRPEHFYQQAAFCPTLLEMINKQLDLLDNLIIPD